MVATKRNWGILEAVILMLIISTFVSVARMAMGNTSLLENPFTRLQVCFGLVAWAYAYYRLDETDWRIAFGVIQIVAATWSNLYQLDKIADPFSNPTLINRWTFVGGAIVVLAHGVKDVGEGAKKRKSRLNPVTPLSTGSSAAPSPGSQAPE